MFFAAVFLGFGAGVFFFGSPFFAAPGAGVPVFFFGSFFKMPVPFGFNTVFAAPFMAVFAAPFMITILVEVSELTVASCLLLKILCVLAN